MLELLYAAFGSICPCRNKIKKRDDGRGASASSPRLPRVSLVVFIYVYIHFQHTHLWIAFRGLPGRILLSPAHHQVQDSNNPVHFNKNLGNCLAVWDWMFGALYVPTKARERLSFGVEPDGRDLQTITDADLSSVARHADDERRFQMTVECGAPSGRAAGGSIIRKLWCLGGAGAVSGYGYARACQAEPDLGNLPGMPRFVC